jgi:hypothetical protein
MFEIQDSQPLGRAPARTSIMYERAIALGFLLSAVVASLGWMTFLGWLIWRLADWALR